LAPGRKVFPDIPAALLEISDRQMPKIVGFEAFPPSDFVAMVGASGG
jgi:hypothetical protein